MRPARIAMLAAMAVTALLASQCAGEDELSQRERVRMRRLIPRGSPYAEARSRLERLGFTCGERAGKFYGNDMHTNSAARFLVCGESEFRMLRIAAEDEVILVVQEGNY